MYPQKRRGDGPVPPAPEFEPKRVPFFARKSPPSLVPFPRSFGLANMAHSAAAGSSHVATASELDALYEKGMLLLKESDLESAIDALGEFLAKSIATYGELDSRCALAYYKYGSALLYRAQEQADVLGEPLAKASAAQAQAQVQTQPQAQPVDGKGKGKLVEEEQDDDDDGDDDGDDDDGAAPGAAPQAAAAAAADDDDDDGTDLALAYKMLELARIIYERHPDAPGSGKVAVSSLRARIGETLMEMEAFQEAAEEFKVAAELRAGEAADRELVFVLFQRCVCECELKRPQDALRSCEQAAAAVAAAKQVAEAKEARALEEIMGDIDAKREEVVTMAEKELEEQKQQQQAASASAAAATTTTTAAAAAAPAPSSTAFSAPTMGAAPVRDLGVVSKGAKGRRVVMAPIATNSEPASKKARTDTDVVEEEEKAPVDTASKPQECAQQ